MQIKEDIKDRADIELLINTFYDKVKKDKIIGYIFNDVVKVNWEKHLPVMYDFWDSLIFLNNKYTGNPMALHIQLNAKTPLTKEHFQQWLQLFTGTVDELFKGRKAGIAKEKAAGIAAIMETKILSPIKIIR
jgi:hemoglobin